MQEFNLIVIGGGPGGYEAAAIAASQGKKVALIERDKLGGTCLNRGCVPTKCLCAAAERLYEAENSREFGIECEVKADYTVAANRSAEVVSSLRSDVEALLSDVTVIYGDACLGAANTVFVAGEEYHADKIIIATGSKPKQLPIPGAELAIDSDRFLQLTELPSSVAIIGGGVIGLEFASVVAAYGKTVTVIEFMPEILPGFDGEIAKRLRSYLSRRGVKFILNARCSSISKADNGYTLKYEGKKGEAVLEAELIISATGRQAVVPEGLDAAGVKVSQRGFIETDENFRTSASGIYAIGDVNGKCMLAHAAAAQAKVVTGVAESIKSIPGVVFTLPECATVGASVDSAADLKAAKIPYSANSKALASGQEQGMVKLVYRESDGKITGCQAVGAHAGDIIAEATIAIDAGYTVNMLAENTVSAHPSISELLTAAATAALRSN